MRLLVDMNLTPRWVSYLMTGGHDAVHWSSLGPLTARDAQICDWARLHRFVVVTNDLDFPQILAHTREAAPSIVLVRGEPLVPEVRAAALLSAIETCADELARGAVLTLDWRDRPRARLLPLR